MELNPSELSHKILLLNRLRMILVLLMRIPLPFLIGITILQILIKKYASALKLNTEIFFYPLIFIVGAAVLSTFFLFYVIIKEKRWAWITLFVVMVVLPCLFYYSISFGNIFTIFRMTVIMVPFYLYFVLLRYTVSEWLAEYEGQVMRTERKREEALRMKKEQEWM
jgi:hypothetical protein